MLIRVKKWTLVTNEELFLVGVLIKTRLKIIILNNYLSFIMNDLRFNKQY